jgi:glycosyltransferase involved in cell wall biosynthesis
MIELALPSENGIGWGIAGNHISAELAKLTETKAVPIDACGTTDNPVLHCSIGPTFEPFAPKYWSARRNICYCFIEDNDIAEKHLEQSRKYDCVCVGSNWAKEQLWSRGLNIPMRVVHQGVDHNIFRYEKVERKPTLLPKFRVLSAGKFEYRKGQDVVIAAMKKFMDKHEDVELVCVWANLWPQSFNTMERSPYINSCFGAEWATTVFGTLVKNDIDVSRVEIIPMLYSAEVMAKVYRSCHVSLFPNRCEAGTNLPLMESLACGVPAIATCATGQADVLNPWNSLWITYDPEPNGWVEPSVYSCLHKLEEFYNARDTGVDHERISEGMNRFGWGATAKMFLEELS